MELTLNEQPGPLHVLAALDIVVLVMVLGFVMGGMAHRAGVPVRMAGSSFRVAAETEAAVLTVKGTTDPVFYLDGSRVGEGSLPGLLRHRRDTGGLRMVLLRADVSLPATVQRRLSELVLAENLECVWLAEPEAEWEK
ncbi:MAG: hypothetical protein Q7Q71_02450 [Verrucomicrobiota bacterium JB023]|nr:hypothetical protein [Verrucomicrobiota bacterium JB023]